MSDAGFTVDMQDIHFVLFEQHKIHERLGQAPRYEDLDLETYIATLNEAEKIAQTVLHPINHSGDREGCSFDGEGNVKTPKGYKEAWDKMAEGGWIAPRADPELGGAGLPTAIQVALTELFSGACMAFMMYPGLTIGAARVILEHAPERMRKGVAEKMFSGAWAGTMCLTEGGAGSSVGDNRCKATLIEGDTYELEGEKIFISGGDQDLTENIVHLVLARTEGSPSGTKGLSLFLVPKFNFDDGLELGERNGAHVLGIEHKMGINGSATCTLGLGTKGKCIGYRVSEECNGMRVMFNMMNEARIGVGVQGLAAGASAYNYSLTYAKERVQGVSIRALKDPNAKQVPIVEHADVRRMLMTQKVLVEGMRSMCFRLAYLFDLSETSADENERKKCARRVDLLVPIMKSICTDIGFDVATDFGRG